VLAVLATGTGRALWSMNTSATPPPPGSNLRDALGQTLAVPGDAGALWLTHFNATTEFASAVRLDAATGAVLATVPLQGTNVQPATMTLCASPDGTLVVAAVEAQIRTVSSLFAAQPGPSGGVVAWREFDDVYALMQPAFMPAGNGSDSGSGAGYYVASLQPIVNSFDVGILIAWNVTANSDAWEQGGLPYLDHAPAALSALVVTSSGMLLVGVSQVGVGAFFVIMAYDTPLGRWRWGYENNTLLPVLTPGAAMNRTAALVASADGAHFYTLVYEGAAATVPSLCTFNYTFTTVALDGCMPLPWLPVISTQHAPVLAVGPALGQITVSLGSGNGLLDAVEDTSTATAPVGAGGSNLVGGYPVAVVVA
jgi:hypothetical protein